MTATIASPCPTENYIILHHVGKALLIPVDPDAMSDNMGVSYAESNPLSRSAPIYSYQNSGPRAVQVTFTLHRDLMRECNPDLKIDGEDPVDYMIENLDALALPDYDAASKIVNPPLVSLKIRDEIYIKGVVAGSVGLTYGLPILKYGNVSKYAMVTVSFGVNEVTPYSASILPSVGGKYRIGSSTGGGTNTNAIRQGTSTRTGGAYSV